MPRAVLCPGWCNVDTPRPQGVYSLIGRVKHLTDQQMCSICLKGEVQIAKGVTPTWES